MAFDALTDLSDRLGDNQAVVRARRVWQHPRGGGLVRAVVGLGGLYLVLRILLRNHEPPTGEFVFGVIVGLLYSMVAFGLILIYRANRIINFAQAEMGACSGVLAMILIKAHHVPYVVAFLIAIGSGIVAGMVVEVVVVRRFYKAPRLILSVATIGVALIFAAIQFYLPDWLGAKNRFDPTPPKTPFSHIHLTIQPQIFDANSLVVIIAVGLVLTALTAFFRLTDIGIAARASAENADRAVLLGIPVKRVSTVVWALAAALSALGLFLRIPVIGMPIGVFIGPVVLVYALAAAVIARMESFGVALVAGIAIGVLEQCLYYFSRDPSIASALMLPILLVAMLVQRGKLSRGQDTGLATWQQAREFRPVPPEMRSIPEVAWGRFVLGALVLAAVIAAPLVMGLKQQILASVVVLYGVVAVSLVILTGWAGQISLGQWGMAGVGAAVAGGLAAHLNADFFVCLVVAGLVGAAVSVVIGLPALRIQGLYLAVTTLAFAIAVQVYVLSPNYFSWLLPTHAQTITRPWLWDRINLGGDRAFYYFCLVILALALASAKALRRSRAGRIMIAARDNSRGAQSYGVSVSTARLWAFAIAGFWAALAGAIFAFHQGVIETQAFDPELSLTLLTIVVIGGVTSLPGALLGTVYIGIMKYGDLSQGTQLLATGFGVLLLLYVLPGGLAQLFYDTRDNLLRWVARRRGIVVPSLVADVRTEDGRTVPEGDVLADAAASVERMGALAGNGHGAAANGDREVDGDDALPMLVRCPECGEIMPVGEAAAHEHFEVAGK